MSNIIHFCHNCNHWEWDDNIVVDGKTYYPGHCGLYSARCINEVSVWFPGRPKPIHFHHLEIVCEEIANA